VQEIPNRAAPPSAGVSSTPNPESPFYKVDDAGFRAEVFLERQRIRVNLAGSADAMAASHLQLILTRVHLETRRHAVQEVVVDFRPLEFMVSSCFKSFLGWIMKVRDCEASAQYPIRFLSDPKHLWQRRSLPSLQAFAQKLVSIDFDILFVD
jgi:hypothetical protein